MDNLIINYWAVLVSAIVSFVIGGIWYGPLFGKKWMALMGITKDGMKSMSLTPARAMTLGFLFTLLQSYVVAHFVVLLGAVDAGTSWSLAFWIWLGIMVPICIGSFLWENKPIKLFVLNAAYQLISLFVMVLILALWK
ncbi:MAG: DUF1761 domain-containing protein [Patescibacteria group bacterium]